MQTRGVAALSATAYAIVAAFFLPHETIWVDETTQLNGIGLGPWGVVRWLTGDPTFANGVPMDRMPPLSYWIAQVWGSLFGSGEHSFRALGLLCTALATFVLASAAGKISGWKGAALVGAVFALNPFNATMGVSIRAYPIFMLFASIAWYAAMQVATDLPILRIRSLALLATVCVLACFAHFYAAVMTASLFGALLVVVLLRRARPWPLVVTGGLVAVPLLGLTPFIFFSRQMSHVADPSKTRTLAMVVHDTGRLMVRTVVSPTVATFPILAVLMTLAVAAMVGLAIFRSEKRSLAIVALLAVAIGLAANAVAAAVGVGFDTLAPHYNLWLSHGVVLACAAALAVSTLRSVGIAAVAGVALLLANLAGEARLLAHPDHFNHGPHREIEALVQSAGGQSLAVVHDPASWGWSYFPLRYVHGADLPQFRSSPDGRSLTRIDANPTAMPLVVLTQALVLVVTTRSLTTKDIAEDLAGSPARWGENPVASVLERGGSWKRVRNVRHVSHVGGEAILFERTGGNTARNSMP